MELMNMVQSLFKSWESNAGYLLYLLFVKNKKYIISLLSPVYVFGLSKIIVSLFIIRL